MRAAVRNSTWNSLLVSKRRLSLDALSGQNSASWAMYQGAGKPALAPGAQTAAHLQAQQQVQSLRKGTGAGTSAAPGKWFSLYFPPPVSFLHRNCWVEPIHHFG